MSQVPAANSIPPSPESQYDGGGLEETNLEDFLKLMIAELQNQDPLDPMKNGEMLEQLGQMRTIGATDRLTETLDAVLVGQNVSTASALIGKEISALDDEGNDVQGSVDRVTVANNDEGGVRIHVGGQSIALTNVREILPTAGEGATP